ncbi:putative transposase [Rhizobiales bacterium GAS191]|nr:putative transposase [Rhizobiales bacterium GAS191]
MSFLKKSVRFYYWAMRISTEMAVMISGKQFWLWRAVDSEGEVLDLLVQRRRNKTAAIKLMRKLLKKQGFTPGVLYPSSAAVAAAAKEE